MEIRALTVLSAFLFKPEKIFVDMPTHCDLFPFSSTTTVPPNLRRSLSFALIALACSADERR
jgi:hypothetical protein